MLDFLRNTNEQLEILLEGFVPNAEQLLPHSDVDLIRNHLPRDEAICAFATGRAVGAGRSVWVTLQYVSRDRFTARSTFGRSAAAGPEMWKIMPIAV